MKILPAAAGRTAAPDFPRRLVKAFFFVIISSVPPRFTKNLIETLGLAECCVVGEMDGRKDRAGTSMVQKCVHLALDHRLLAIIRGGSQIKKLLLLTSLKVRDFSNIPILERLVKFRSILKHFSLSHAKTYTVQEEREDEDTVSQSSSNANNNQKQR